MFVVSEVSGARTGRGLSGRWKMQCQGQGWYLVVVANGEVKVCCFCEL